MIQLPVKLEFYYRFIGLLGLLLPRKYRVQIMSKVSFNNKKSPFFDALKEKVETYFKDKNLKETGNIKLHYKTFLLIPAAIALYIVLVFFTPSVWVSILLCALLGSALASIGFNVMHDGAHGSYSQYKWINRMMSHSLSAMGGSAFMWKIKHNQIHHSYTNIHGMDDDLDNRPFFRITPEDPKYKMHRYQHYYWVLLYMLSYASWVFVQDFIKYFTGRIGEIKIRKMTFLDHIKFWGSKIFYIGAFIVLPMFTVGVVSTIVGYLIVAFFCGFIISVVFQLAHVVEHADFPQPSETTNKIEQEWAIHQVTTTVNFATRNKWISWFVGGLNYQVEHHLFPRISHIHYPQISKLVRETCKQFNIAYLEYPTMLSAIRSHVTHLKIMGRA